MTRQLERALCGFLCAMSASSSAPRIAMAAPPPTHQTHLKGTTCLEHEKAYVDHDVVVTVPNGAYVGSAKVCQEQCNSLPTCRYFTFYEESQPTPGACWLLGPSATWKLDAEATSGPKSCTDLAANASGWVDTVTDTVGNTVTALGAANTTSGGLPWWAWGLIAVAIVAVGAGLAVISGVFLRGGQKQKSRKGKTRGTALDSEEESFELADVDSPDASPLAVPEPAPTHSVPLPMYSSTSSYSALPTAPPPLVMAQVTPRGSNLPRLSVMPQAQESFYTGAARASVSRSMMTGQSFSGPSFGGEPVVNLPQQQSFSGLPQQHSFPGLPPQHQSFNH